AHKAVDCRGSVAAATAAEHGLELAVRTEIVDAFDRHQLGEARARPIDAALDRADGTAADARGLLVGKARRPDQHQRLALVRRQLAERGTEFLELYPARLFGLRLQGLRIRALAVRHL